MTKKRTMLTVLVVLAVVVIGGVFLSGSNLMGLIFTRGPVLQVSLDPSTPRISILVAGTKEQRVANFKFTSTDDNITISSLSLNCSGGGVLGSADNNIAVVKLYGPTMKNAIKSGVLTNGVVNFDGLNLVVPKDQEIVLSLKVDLNTILGGATPGESFSFKIGDVVATGTPTKKGGVVTAFASKADSSKSMFIYETEPSLTLDPSSPPQGARSVSASDKVMVFNVSASSTEKVILKKIIFDLVGTGEFALDSNVSASLEKEGVVIASGPVVVQSGSNAEVTLSLANDYAEIAKGTTEKYSLVLDSAELIDEVAGTLELFAPCISIPTSPIASEEGFVWNDTNNDVKWIDRYSLPHGESNFCGNTLQY